MYLLLFGFIGPLRPSRLTFKLPSFSVIRQISSILTVSQLFIILFYNIFPAHSWSFQWSFNYSILFNHCTWQRILASPSMASPLYSSYSDNLQYIRTTILCFQLYILLSSPLLCYFVFDWIINSPKHFLFKDYESVFVQFSKWPCFWSIQYNWSYQGGI